jgi:PhnB protein
MQAVTPYLLYEDVASALRWLSDAFGFEEVLRFEGADGVVNHAELRSGGDSIYLGWPGPDYRSPMKLGTRTSLVHVYVDDVEAHCDRARRAGAEIAREPEDQPYGDRRYDAYDLEGQMWSFATRGRGVPPAEWGATGPATPPG